eukprot:scaffold107580_cov66-Phaeocystis_antarctica.AAC.2
MAPKCESASKLAPQRPPRGRARLFTRVYFASGQQVSVLIVAGACRYLNNKRPPAAPRPENNEDQNKPVLASGFAADQTRFI